MIVLYYGYCLSLNIGSRTSFPICDYSIVALHNLFSLVCIID
uniref:Uncharacterized protein n=1 Tax=Rhizophora mucronata TaxID=61149 RepID=A0A2P2NZB4_RHIMU